MIFITKNSTETKKLGEKLAKHFLAFTNRPIILALQGDLGGGKTTFLQGFVKGLGIKEKITSPTFVILKRFQLNNLTIKQFNNFYHFDCYRIDKPEDILSLGFKEIITNSQNIVAIEWSEKIQKILPKDAIKIKFEFINQNTRKIAVKS